MSTTRTLGRGHRSLEDVMYDLKRDHQLLNLVTDGVLARYLGAGRVCLTVVRGTSGEQLREKSKRTVAATYYRALAWQHSRWYSCCRHWLSCGERPGRAKLRLLKRKQQENKRHVRKSGNHFHEEKGC